MKEWLMAYINSKKSNEAMLQPKIYFKGKENSFLGWHTGTLKGTLLTQHVSQIWRKELFFNTGKRKWINQDQSKGNFRGFFWGEGGAGRWRGRNSQLDKSNQGDVWTKSLLQEITKAENKRIKETCWIIQENAKWNVIFFLCSTLLFIVYNKYFILHFF